jgi:hypothetical protein
MASVDSPEMFIAMAIGYLLYIILLRDDTH